MKIEQKQQNKNIHNTIPWDVNSGNLTHVRALSPLAAERCVTDHIGSSMKGLSGWEANCSRWEMFEIQDSTGQWPPHWPNAYDQHATTPCIPSLCWDQTSQCPWHSLLLPYTLLFLGSPGHHAQWSLDKGTTAGNVETVNSSQDSKCYVGPSWEPTAIPGRANPAPAQRERGAAGAGPTLAHSPQGARKQTIFTTAGPAGWATNKAVLQETIFKEETEKWKWTGWDQTRVKTESKG